ncbi:MAG TPA: hypothetical protein PLY47_06605, partial [Rhodoglobus sp.]|nr:hypothetical protein [Rhodoglobus sp.]
IHAPLREVNRSEKRERTREPAMPSTPPGAAILNIAEQTETKINQMADAASARSPIEHSPLQS